jgi:hypothetical protein
MTRKDTDRKKEKSVLIRAIRGCQILNHRRDPWLPMIRHMKPLSLLLCFVIAGGVAAFPAIGSAEQRVVDLDWSDLKFDGGDRTDFAVSQLPDRIRELKGKRVRIRGKMMPGFKVRGIDSFFLVPQLRNDFSSKLPRLDEVIFVKMTGGKTVDYSGFKPIQVVGRFEFHVIEGAEQTMCVMQIIAESAERVQK